MNEVYNKYVEQFLNGNNSKCRAYFEKIGAFVEMAYCDLVQGKLDKAYKVFDRLEEENTRAKWGKFLIQIIKNDLTAEPQYFEIRNFLEIDINILMTYKKFNYIEKILNYSKFMARCNPETLKYIGRVLWANNFIQEAVMFLENGKNLLYNDPELHYLLGYIYHFEYNDDKLALKSLQTSVDILPGYFPAEHLISVITKE